MSKRLGVAKGKFSVSDEPVDVNKLVEDAFLSSASGLEGAFVHAQPSIENLLLEIGTGLKEFRQSKNMGQSALAEKAGISVGKLSDLEHGKGGSLRDLVSVLIALGRVSWLGFATSDQSRRS